MAVVRDIARPIVRPVVNSITDRLGFNWAAYWEGHLFDEDDLNLWIKEDSRSGLTLTDSISGVSGASICPSYVSMGDKYYAYVADNGALDIGATDFTFGMWVKSNGGTGYRAFGGKIIEGSPDGSYGLIVRSGTSYLDAAVVSSGTYIDIIDTVTAESRGWMFAILDVNQTTQKVRFFINNTQISTDKSFTGTFANPGNNFKFMLSSGNNAAGDGTYVPGQSSHSDTIILNRLLTPTERANCQLGIYPTDCKARWICNNHNIYDVSGNGYHLTGVNRLIPGIPLSYMNVKRSAYGSRHNLDLGYSIYKKLHDIDIQVPFSDAGVALVAPSVPEGYTKDSDVAADLLNHNLADSNIQMVSALWDRSDVTIWSDLARDGYYDDTDADTKKQWHISELRRDNISNWLVAAHKEDSFVKVLNNSINDRLKLKEIISYDTPKAGADLNKVLAYTGDYGIAITPNKPTYAAGVALMFDDSSRSASFKATDDVLTPSHGWQNTYFLNGAGGTQADINSLLANGHEIANHSVNHIDWKTYLLTHTVEEFFNTEIAPEQIALFNAYGITPSCYGYALVAGMDDELNSYILSHGFTHVRPASAIWPSIEAFNIFSYNGGSGIIDALSADFFNPNDTIGNAEITNYLKMAKAANKIVLIIMHTVDHTNTTNGSNSIKLSRLQMICDFVVNNGMKFYKTSELVPSVFGL